MTDPQPIPETREEIESRIYLAMGGPFARGIGVGELVQSWLTRARAEAREAALGPVTEGEMAAWRRVYMNPHGSAQACREAATNALLASRRDAVEPAGNEDWDRSG